MGVSRRQRAKWEEMESKLACHAQGARDQERVDLWRRGGGGRQFAGRWQGRKSGIDIVISVFFTRVSVRKEFIKASGFCY